MSAKTTIAPFRLKPWFSERPWGRKSLKPWYDETGTDALVGEAWLTGPQCVVEEGDFGGRTLESMLGGRQVTRYKDEGEQYDVIVQVTPRDRANPTDISGIYVRARDGSMVQLDNLLGVHEGVSP